MFLQSCIFILNAPCFVSNTCNSACRSSGSSFREVWIMKKLMLLMLALAACVWGEVFIKDSIHIVFPKYVANYLIDNEEECVLGFKPNGKMARPYMSPYGWCGGYVCNSILDTSVFFLEEEIGDNCYGFDYFFREKGVSTNGEECMVYSFYVLSDASHSLIDVIQDEFRRFQECGLFDITKGNLDSILSRMETVLVADKYHSTTYVTDCGNGNGCMQECLLTGPCFSSENTNMGDVIAKRNASISIPYSVDFVSRFAVENGYLIVPANLEFRKYALYDLSGRILRRGYLRNHMVIPRQPIILRVKDYGDVYLK